MSYWVTPIFSSILNVHHGQRSIGKNHHIAGVVVPMAEDPFRRVGSLIGKFVQTRAEEFIHMVLAAIRARVVFEKEVHFEAQAVRVERWSVGAAGFSQYRCAQAVDVRGQRRCLLQERQALLGVFRP